MAGDHRPSRKEYAQRHAARQPRGSEAVFAGRDAAERSVLGGILTDPPVFDFAAQYLTAEYFGLPAHRKIFRCMEDVTQSGRVPTIALVVAEMELRGELTDVGGAVYISSLLDGVVADPASIETNAKLIREAKAKSELLLLAERIPSVDGSARELIWSIESALKKAKDIADDSVEMRRRLRGLPVEPGPLVRELDQFFSDHAWLPSGCSLTLALWALNSQTYDVFHSTPYLLLQSALPGCGKTTVMDLLCELCPGAFKTSSATEAALFRVIEAHH